MRHTHGSIEVVCGSMFSGKTDELIRRLVRATIAKQKVQVFKPAIDVRYAVEKVTSHAGSSFDAIPVEKSAEIHEKLEADTTVVGIDEAQFFDERLVEVVDRLANMGKRVIVAGLDQDFMGRAFDPIPQLLAKAEEITKTLAICVQCGNPANYTQRLVPSEETIVVGGSNEYEARCRQCFEPRLAQAELPLTRAAGETDHRSDR